MIGVGIITCNREELFGKCIASLPWANSVVIINDGEEYSEDIFPPFVTEVIQHRKNVGVGRSKNEAFRFLMSKGCKHIFLIEDDVKIIREDVYEAYIKGSECSGINHLNYAFHGPANKNNSGQPTENIRIEFKNNTFLSFHSHLAGAFSYYNRTILEKIGLIDERFVNFYDHVDHTLQMIKSNFHPPFGWFADISDSNLYIEDLDPDLSKSIIRKKKFQFRVRLKLYSYLFRFKNGFTVDDYPRATKNEFFEFLKHHTNYNSG